MACDRIESTGATARPFTYSVKSVNQEPGTAPFKGSLKLAQAQSCADFFDRAMFWKVPSHNLICGDKDGNIALLRLAADLGLIARDLSDAVRDAYRDYRRRQHALRLNGAQYARVPHEEVSTQIEATRALWRAVFGTDSF